MKRLIVILIVFSSTIAITFGQVPNSFRYQAVIRNAAGDLVANKLVGFEISILSGSAVGQVVYAEVFEYATNEFGIVSLNVGGGSPISGDFSQIDWSASTYYLQVEIDIDGGDNYQFMGTSQILAVPYALQALNVTNKDDADANPNNEIQTISKNGNTVTLSNSGGSFTDGINDADADPQNEIQDLVLNENILQITNNLNATPINLSPYQGTNTDEQELTYTFLSNMLNLTIGEFVGTGGNTVNIPLVSANGGTFTGSISATNLSGTNTGDMSNADVVNAYQTGYSDYFTTADGFKLEGIESGATADMDDSEIVAAYQNGYPNYFNNTDRTKLNGIETGAEADMTNIEIVTAYNTGFPEHFTASDGTKLDYLSLSNNFTVTGGSVLFTATGSTTLALPTEGGTLATRGWVNDNSLDNSLSTGRIFVGEDGDAVELDARGAGQILIGTTDGLVSELLSGDGSVSIAGELTINSINGNNISLGASFTTTTDNITLNANAAGSNVTLPELGTLATVGNTMSTSHPANGIALADISNWNTAYGWDDHSSQGYITDGNTNWDNTYNFITASSTETFTNKSGSNNMWTNDQGYLTSTSGVTSITGTANQITASASTGVVTLSLPSTISGLTSVSSTGFTGAIGSGTASTGAFTTISASDNITLSANTQTLTHSGTTSLIVSSTSGFVGVEDIQFSSDYIGISGTTQILQLESTEFSVNVDADINGDIDVSGSATISGNVTIGEVLHLTPLASAPSSPSEGDIYVDTDHHIYCYLDGDWIQLDNIP